MGDVDSREAPLSTHSQCFIYGPLHFWLWWLKYLSSYLNCIFKDFIQYLHAIQYELIFFFFFANLFFCYLIVFICIFWHVLSLLFTNKHACWIYFRRKMLLRGTFPVCFCVSWFWWQLNTKKQVLEMFAGWPKLCYHPLLPVGITGPEQGHGVHNLVQGTENFWAKKKKKSLFSVLCPVMIWVFIFCSDYHFIEVCTLLLHRQSSSLYFCCYDPLSLKKHIIGNNEQGCRSETILYIIRV